MQQAAFLFVVTMVLWLIVLMPSNTIEAYESIVRETAVNAQSSKELEVDCPKPKKAIGAGWATLDVDDTRVEGVVSFFDATRGEAGWSATATVPESREWKLRLRVVCVKT